MRILPHRASETKRSYMKKFWIPIIILLVCLLIAGTVWIVIDLTNQHRDESYAEEVRMLYRPEGTAALPLPSEETPLPSAPEAQQTAQGTETHTDGQPTPEPEEPGEEPLRMHPDFEKLYEINPHIIGWLTAGKDVDYPVVQYDNTYYLGHNFNREVDRNGTLFMNAANVLTPRDDVILIHGHHMESGVQFGRLQDFKSYAYLSEYPIVTFRTIYEDTAELYVPFAAFDASVDHEKKNYFDFLQLRFADDVEKTEGEARSSAAFRAYLDELLSRSVWTSPVDVNESDAVLILLTCSNGWENSRFALCCRKLRDGETRETVQAGFP